MSEENEITEHEDWTPFRGMIRGIVAGIGVAAVLGVAANLVAWHVPCVAMNGWIRTFATLLTMWLLFLVVHRAAGMSGLGCTTTAVVLALAIGFSQQVVFAVHGVSSLRGSFFGWSWSAPARPLMVEAWTLIGVIFGVLLWRDGVSVRSLVDIFRLRTWR